MRVLKISVVGAALTVALSASVFAQTAPPAGAPKPQAPPATPPAAQTPPAAPKAPPVPFPQDAKIAFIDVNMIAGTSAAGKDASKKLRDFTTKMSGELGV